jgi:hypothetical protein
MRSHSCRSSLPSIGACLVIAGLCGSVLSTTFVTAAETTGPLDRGIQNLKEIQQKRRAQVDQLKEEAAEHVASIAEAVYEAYGQPRDPGRVLVELKNLLNETAEGIRAGRMGEATEALGHASQLALDLWSEKNPNVQAINVGQQIAWELAEAGQILRERSARESELSRDDQVLGWLETKNEALKNRASSQQQKPPKPPNGGGTTASSQTDPSDAALDESERLQRWLDVGNRSFDSRQQEDQFYRDYPMLKPLRTVAETRSPADEANDMKALELIDEASTEARRRKEALKAEDQRRVQEDKDLDDALQDLAQAREDETTASAPQRVAIPEDVLKRIIPPGWVPCQCPGRHPNAGLLIDGARWHSPAIDCSMVF